jgi:hypothetical protein
VGLSCAERLTLVLRALRAFGAAFNEEVCTG